MANRAVCIGINNYPGTDSDLSGCVNDADDWAELLTDRGFAVTDLLDRDATKKKMLAAIREVVEATGAGQVGVVTYSGHGTWVPDEDGDEEDERDEAICPHDVNRVGALLDDELYEVFAERERGARIVFISDSCHSGGVNRMAIGEEEEERAARVRFLPPQAFLPDEKLMRAARLASVTASRRLPTSALLMSGCRPTELSWDAWFGSRANGAFTKYALRTLRGLGAEATYAEWMKAVRRVLPSRSYPQSPQLAATRAQRKWRVFG